MFLHRPPDVLEPDLGSSSTAHQVGETDNEATAPPIALPFGLGAGNPDDVVSAMGHWADGSVSLEPDKRRPIPMGPKLPFGDNVKAVEPTIRIERLLTSKDVINSQPAEAAMKLLLGLPESQRTTAIDTLDPKAFDNLLKRVSPKQREQLAGLVGSSKNPERRLRLWAESHKSKATNEVARRKGDTGPKGTRRRDLPPDQAKNRREHHRRRHAAEDTHKEVDRETKLLLKKAKAGKLSLADVDAMRSRKDLEHSIELEHSINLTNQTARRKDGSQVVWSESELKRVQTAMSLLPDDHIHHKKGFKNLKRVESEGAGTGAVHSGTEIRVADRGTKERPGGFVHGGDKREMVSDDFKKKHGGTIGTLEYVMTHEIGHDVDGTHPEAFEKFKAAAGWDTADEADLSASGLTAAQRAHLKRDQRRSPAARSDQSDANKTYRAAAGGDYHERPTTSIPARGEATRGIRSDSWRYARTSPAEHFAETYAKAVHVPERLYADLVQMPQDRAKQAQAQLDAARKNMAARKRDRNMPSPTDEELKQMAGNIAKHERAVAKAKQAASQRGKQFNIMRNHVFGTDKAVSAASARLRAAGALPKAIAAFEAGAAKASTPQQVETLESQVPR